MKKLTALFLAAGMVMAASAPASAVDVKFNGRYQFTFQTQSQKFNGQNLEQVSQRLRLGATFAASENLSGYMEFQFGTEQWGARDYKHGSYGKDGVMARMVYIDWKVPATAIKVRMGRQTVALPAEAFGDNSVLSGGWGVHDGIVVSSPVTDWLGLSAMWLRAGVDKSNLDTDNGSNSDFFAAVANLKFNGISGAVYGAYAALDEFSGKALATDGTVNIHDIKQDLPNFEGDAYWIGATATLSAFDPFVLKLSAVYGEANANGNYAADKDKAWEGWNVQAKASYKLGFGTPVVGAWYASGADENGEGGNMPSLAGRFMPTRSYNDNAKALHAGSSRIDMDGTWGAQLGIEKVSFLQGLSHDVLVTYVQGTNDDKNASKWNSLTTEDSFWSFDVISSYKIYKNLSAHLELSYIINDFRDEATCDEDDWRAGLTFEYKF